MKLNAKRELLRVKKFAKNNFDLDSRVGLVCVQTMVEEYGCEVWVAKYELRHGYPLAIFRGDALV